MQPELPADLESQVQRALDEDIGGGDVTAQLVPAERSGQARTITRDSAVVCGLPWVSAVFRRIDPRTVVEPLLADGDVAQPEQVLFRVRGPARALLSGERTALNFLQTLSATATATRRYVDAIAGTTTQIVDTRKTLPGLRLAQKYAVRCGGGHNHRIGLYDGILIKENHIAAAGGIHHAIAAARALNAGVPLMTEAETLEEAQAALLADVDLLLVDDLPLTQLREAVAWTRQHRASGGRTLIEYSGNTTLERVLTLAETGVDRISIGAITKHVHAIDLSMRMIEGE